MADRIKFVLKDDSFFLGYTDLEDKQNAAFEWENIWELREWLNNNPGKDIMIRRVDPSISNTTRVEDVREFNRHILMRDTLKYCVAWEDA